MIDTWFTSDTHFGHKAILEFEPAARPFKTIEEMHEVMIERWNACVKPNDIVYHLGDFCFGRANIAIADALNGKKRLVLGNHDSYNASDYLRYFHRLYGVRFWKMCILSHVPVHSYNLSSRAFLNVHGHLHSRRVQRLKPFTSIADVGFINDENYFNVSCEQNNLTPFHSDQILERLKQITE